MFIFHGTTKFWKTLLMWPCGPSPNHFRGMPWQDILSSFVNDLLVLPMIWKAIRVCNVLKTWHTTWPARVLNGMSESAVSKKCDDIGHIPQIVPLNHLYWCNHHKGFAQCNSNSKRQSTSTNQSLRVGFPKNGYLNGPEGETAMWIPRPLPPPLPIFQWITQWVQHP